MSSPTINERLNAKFSDNVIRQLSKGGTKLDYIPIAEVIARLNSVLGTENWGEQDTEAWRDPANPEWILARTTIWVRGEDGFLSTKTGYGGQKIKTTRAGDIVDLGDEYKGAHSDAFKKACTKLGVGLHLARDEAAILQEDYDNRSFAPAISDDVRTLLGEAVAALNEEDTEALKKEWGKNGLPPLKREDFTEAHAEIAARLIGVKLP